jgi:hypothetical protein
MMKVWLVCFFALFALAEFFQWLRDFSIPLPIYILGGVLLAVASNYNKIFGDYLNNISITTPIEVPQEIPRLESTANPIPTSLLMSTPVSDVQHEEM